MTDRLSVEWPDPGLLTARGGRPVRILAISDEPDPSLEAARTRQALGAIDLVIGCGDLKPDYLDFVGDAFCVPVHYVRGNHDVGESWELSDNDPTQSRAPEALPDGRVVREAGIRIVGFSGSPPYSARGFEVPAGKMWWRVGRFGLFQRRGRPLLVVTHAAPRDAGDGPDQPHRGFRAFRWLAERLQPPLWLHGHTTLARRDREARSTRLGRTLLYNCVGSTLVELTPPDGGPRRHSG